MNNNGYNQYGNPGYFGGPQYSKSQQQKPNITQEDIDYVIAQAIPLVINKALEAVYKYMQDYADKQLIPYVKDCAYHEVIPSMYKATETYANNAFKQIDDYIKKQINHNIQVSEKNINAHMRPFTAETIPKSVKTKQTNSTEAECQGSTINHSNNLNQPENKETYQIGTKCEEMYEPTGKDEIDFERYVKGYIQLQKEEGFSLNQAIEKFWHRWNIERFKCANSSEKIQDPDIKPKFKSEEDGYFWAAPLDKKGYYMVLPAIKITYEATRHNSMGFKEAFISGYTNGAFDIKPEKPAIFKKDNNTWSIVRDGKLRLFRS
mgnify:CR=1 FL=1